MTRLNLNTKISLNKMIIFSALLLSTLLLAGCANRSEQNNDASLHSSSRLVAQGNGICLDTRTGKMWQVGRSRTIRSLEAAQEIPPR